MTPTFLLSCVLAVMLASQTQAVHWKPFYKYTYLMNVKTYHAQTGDFENQVDVTAEIIPIAQEGTLYTLRGELVAVQGVAIRGQPQAFPSQTSSKIGAPFTFKMDATGKVSEFSHVTSQPEQISNHQLAFLRAFEHDMEQQDTRIENHQTVSGHLGQVLISHSSTANHNIVSHEVRHRDDVAKYTRGTPHTPRTWDQFDPSNPVQPNLRFSAERHVHVHKDTGHVEKIGVKEATWQASDMDKHAQAGILGTDPEDLFDHHISSGTQLNTQSSTDIELQSVSPGPVAASEYALPLELKAKPSMLAYVNPHPHIYPPVNPPQYNSTLTEEMLNMIYEAGLTKNNSINAIDAAMRLRDNCRIDPDLCYDDLARVVPDTERESEAMAVLSIAAEVGNDHHRLLDIVVDTLLADDATMAGGMKFVAMTRFATMRNPSPAAVAYLEQRIKDTLHPKYPQAVLMAAALAHNCKRFGNRPDFHEKVATHLDTMLAKAWETAPHASHAASQGTLHIKALGNLADVDRHLDTLTKFVREGSRAERDTAFSAMKRMTSAQIEELLMECVEDTQEHIEVKHSCFDTLANRFLPDSVIARIANAYFNTSLKIQNHGIYEKSAKSAVQFYIHHNDDAHAVYTSFGLEKRTETAALRDVCAIKQPTAAQAFTGTFNISGLLKLRVRLLACEMDSNSTVTTLGNVLSQWNDPRRVWARNGASFCPGTLDSNVGSLSSGTRAAVLEQAKNLQTELRADASPVFGPLFHDEIIGAEKGATFARLPRDNWQWVIGLSGNARYKLFHESNITRRFPNASHNMNVFFVNLTKFPALRDTNAFTGILTEGQAVLVPPRTFVYFQVKDMSLVALHPAVYQPKPFAIADDCFHDACNAVLRDNACGTVDWTAQAERIRTACKQQTTTK